jgi:fatty acid desaturase
VDTVGCWLSIVAAWTAAFLWPHPAVILAAAVVVGTRYYALFIIGHDGMHRRLLPTARTNDLFCDLFLLGPIGAVTRINNQNHLAHHRHLATDADPDRHKHGCFNKSTQVTYLAFLTGLPSLLPAVQHVFLGETTPTTERRGPPDRARYTGRDAAVLIGWQAVLIGGLTWAIGWWAYFALWLLPVYVLMYLADLLRSFAEHSHPEADSKADRHRLVTFISNPLERVFFSPMSMNFHTAHHLWTSIPYYNLAVADQAIRNRSGAANLEWRGSYVGYLLRYFLALPLDECRRDRAEEPVG